MGALKEDIVRKILDSCSDGEDWINMAEWLAEEIEELLEITTYLMTMTWKDTAAGVWLDRVGAIVGVRRPQNEELERVFRCRGDSDPSYDPLHGFGSDNPVMGGLLSGDNGVPAVGLADDEAYLDLINIKINATKKDGSVPGLARFVQNSFDGITCTITVPQVFVVEMELSGTFNLQQRRWIQRYAPRVAGVDLLITNYPEF